MRLPRFDDRGSTTVEAVLVIPVLMLLLLVAVQLALWSHASQVVHTAASEGDASARSYGGGNQLGEARAQQVLGASQSTVIGPAVRVTVLPGDEVKVTVIATGFERAGLPPIARRMRTTAMLESAQAARLDLPRTEPARVEPPRVEVVMEAPAPEPVYAEPQPVEVAPEPQHPQFEEPPIVATAHANGPTEPLFDDLDVPPILKRDRRFVQ